MQTLVPPPSTIVEQSTFSEKHPHPHPMVRWGARALIAAILAASLAIDLSALFVIPVLFVLVVPFEKLFPRHRGQRLRRPGLGTDLTYAAASPVMNVIGVGVAIVVGIVSFAWLPGLLIRPLVALIPVALLPIVAIVLFDVAIYWVHRWSHEVPALWRFHAVHHSTRTMDWVSGFRNHPFDGAIVAPPFVFLLAAGFDPVFAGVLAVVQIVSGLFVHANVRWRLRPLHPVIITPEFHHWHHANETDAHNSNYSVFLPVWDIVFGTYYMPRNKRPLVYGISEPMPDDMLGQLREPLAAMGNPLRRARHPLATIKVVRHWVAGVVGGIWASTTRPRVGRPRANEPCRWASIQPDVSVG